MTLPAFAAARRCCWTPEPAAVDRYLLRRGAQQQARYTPLLLSIDGIDRRAIDCFIDLAPAYCADSVSNLQLYDFIYLKLLVNLLTSTVSAVLV